MELNVVAQRYAGALAQLGKQNMKPVFESLSVLHSVMQSSHSVRVFFEAPGIPLELKTQKAKSILQDKLDEQVLNLFLVLIARARVSVLSEIYESFKNIYHKQIGQVDVKVSLSRAFPQTQQEELEEKIAQTIDAQKEQFGLEQKDLNYVIETKVDPSLLGGLTIRIEDYLLDGSVSEYLNRWRRDVGEKKINNEKAWLE